jgi:large subunit ribosomal protein L29
MAVLRIKDVRRMSDEDLNRKLNELRLELLKEMGSVRMGRAVKNPGRIRELRRAIARILTVKRERTQMV